MTIIRLESVRGTKDILFEEAEVLRDIESKAQEIFTTYGYRQIRTPILESRDLFIRSLGNETEIVGKQMFELKRRGDDNDVLVLRPEATAGIVRAYLASSLYRKRKKSFIKLYYIGPMFRAERPQRGRLRQFHQIGIEAIGSDSAVLDAEVISLADSLLKALSISGYTIKINSLGCLKDKKRLSDELRRLLEDKLSLLCADCRDRYNRNVFRVLDCKNDACKNIVVKLKLSRKNYLCKGCLEHFESVLDNLKSIGTKCQEDVYLARGLDYYTRTVFEVVHPALGAQDALCAGGRYDNLTEQLGGEPVGAIGFAFGMERLASVKDSLSIAPSKNSVYIITLDKKAEREGFVLLHQLRENNIPCEFNFEDKSLKAQMRSANNLGVKSVILLGEDELKNNTVSFKNMRDGVQETIKREQIIDKVKNIT